MIEWRSRIGPQAYSSRRRLRLWRRRRCPRTDHLHHAGRPGQGHQHVARRVVRVDEDVPPDPQAGRQPARRQNTGPRLNRSFRRRRVVVAPPGEPECQGEQDRVTDQVFDGPGRGSDGPAQYDSFGRRSDRAVRDDGRQSPAVEPERGQPDQSPDEHQRPGSGTALAPLADLLGHQHGPAQEDSQGVHGHQAEPIHLPAEDGLEQCPRRDHGDGGQRSRRERRAQLTQPLLEAWDRGQRRGRTVPRQRRRHSLWQWRRHGRALLRGLCRR